MFLPGRTEAWTVELQLFLLARICKMLSHLPASSFDMKRIFGTYCSSPWLPTGISSSFLNYLALSNVPLPKSKWLNIWNETHQQNSGWVLRSHWLWPQESPALERSYWLKNLIKLKNKEDSKWLMCIFTLFYIENWGGGRILSQIIFELHKPNWSWTSDPSDYSTQMLTLNIQTIMSVLCRVTDWVRVLCIFGKRSINRRTITQALKIALKMSIFRVHVVDGS